DLPLVHLLQPGKIRRPRILLQQQGHWFELRVAGSRVRTDRRAVQGGRAAEDESRLLPDRDRAAGAEEAGTRAPRGPALPRRKTPLRARFRRQWPCSDSGRGRTVGGSARLAPS